VYGSTMALVPSSCTERRVTRWVRKGSPMLSLGSDIVLAIVLGNGRTKQ
jgi:hypothetical protein